MVRSEIEEQFLWGVATAGHQSEGGNSASDIWALEHTVPTLFSEPSGAANDSWNRWPEDLDIAARLGLNAFRFSVEWSRIEPIRGEIRTEALDHYERVVDGCLERGLAPIVTFNHFASPNWFAAAGSWLAPDAPDLFAAYCERIASRFGDRIAAVITINEPNLEQLLQSGEKLPPAAERLKVQMLASAADDAGTASYFATNVIPADKQEEFQEAMTVGHRAARAAIKAQHSDLQIGVSIAICDETAVEGGEERRDRKRAAVYDHWLREASEDDFIGVQNYERIVHGPEGQVIGHGPRNGMGTVVEPASLAGAVRYAHQVSGVPVLVTEHGIQTDDDAVRQGFITDSLDLLAAEMEVGVPVLGYCHWTLMDNFEWIFGYKPKLGLFEVDRASLERQPKPSAKVYAATIARLREANPRMR